MDEDVFFVVPETFSQFVFTGSSQPREGFRMFISSCFFLDHSDRRVLVDPGPASTIPLLVELLNQITDRLDLISLSHIHLDHSRGLGQLLESQSPAQVLVHPKGYRYLSRPQRLLQASLDTLRDGPPCMGNRFLWILPVSGKRMKSD